MKYLIFLTCLMMLVSCGTHSPFNGDPVTLTPQEFNDTYNSETNTLDLS